MSKILRTLLLAAGVLVAGQAAAQVTLFEHDGFQGRSFTADRTIWNFDRLGFNDVASSAVVRGGSWEVCQDARFDGRCVVLRPGDYPSLRSVGLNDRISSIRQIETIARNEVYPERRLNQAERRFSQDDTRYDYRGDGWRYDRFAQRWERY